MSRYLKNYFNPNGMSFKNWGNQLKSTYSNLFIPYPPEEEFWMEWAAFIFKNKEFCNGPIPAKEIYGHWLPWANDLVKYITTKGI